MLFSIRVLEFWVSETTNIYDFLHLLSLIKNIPNTNFGGGFGICTYMSQYTFFFFFFPLKGSGEKLTSKDQTKK
jgi:hypothetical protein